MPKPRTEHDPDSSIERLATAIRKATRSARFLVAGHLPVVDPGLVVEGLGRVPVPLKTTGSFDRAVKRFEKDRRLLSSLPPVS